MSRDGEGRTFAAYGRVLCVDGDTIYSGNALLDGMAIVLKNPSEVVGVTSYFGTSRHPEAKVVGGRRPVDLNWLSVLQNIGLMRSFLVNRLAFSAIGAMMCRRDPFAVVAMLLFTALIVAAPSVLAVLIDNRQHRDYRTRDLVTMSLYSLLDLALFKPIILVAGLKGSLDFLKGKKGWDKFERNVRAPAPR